MDPNSSGANRSSIKEEPMTQPTVDVGDHSLQLEMRVDFGVPPGKPIIWKWGSLEEWLQKQLKTVVVSQVLFGDSGLSSASVVVSERDKPRLRKMLPIVLRNPGGWLIHVKLSDNETLSEDASILNQFFNLTSQDPLVSTPLKVPKTEVVDLTDTSEEESSSTRFQGSFNQVNISQQQPQVLPPESPVFVRRPSTPQARVSKAPNSEPVQNRIFKKQPFEIAEPLSEIDHIPPVQPQPASNPHNHWGNYGSWPIPVQNHSKNGMPSNAFWNGPPGYQHPMPLLSQPSPTGTTPGAQENSNSSFEAWAKIHKLKPQTVDKLKVQDLDDFDAVKILTEDDVKEMGFTIGQRKFLLLAIESLKGPPPPKESLPVPEDMDTSENQPKSRKGRAKSDKGRKRDSQLEASQIEPKSRKKDESQSRELESELSSEMETPTADCSCSIPSLSSCLSLKQVAYSVSEHRKFGCVEVMKAEESLSDDPSPLLLIAKNLFQLDSATILKINPLVPPQDEETPARPQRACRKGIVPAKSVKSDHPLDKVMMLIYHSDEFLLQDLLVKLSRCHIAVPWIFMDRNDSITYLSWALQNINVKYGSEDGSIHEQPLVSTPFSLISFLRFGAGTTSKSFVASRVLSSSTDDHHHYFWHRDGLSNSKPKELSKGVVDVGWYLPTGNKEDQFTVPLLISNLHGCASKFPKQARFLTKKSRIICVLLSDQELREHLEEVKKLLLSASSTLRTIFILEFNEEASHQIFNSLTRAFFKKDKNIAIYTHQLSSEDISEQVRIQIKKYLEEKVMSESQSFKIENSSGSSDSHDFDIDTNHACMVTIEEYSSRVAGMLKRQPKEHVLKLQQLSETISSSEKECEKQSKRPESVSVTEYIEELHSKIKKTHGTQEKIVKKQFEEASKSALCEFLMIIRSQSRENMASFMRTFQFHLDKATRKKLGPLRKTFYKNEAAISRLKTADQIDQSELENLKKSRKTIMAQINSAQLGLEHILRELAIVDNVLGRLSPNELHRPEWSFKLAELHVSMLLQGIPMEIMDGDSGSVQLEWIKKVFTAAERQIESSGGKIAILSVLGVQSSGKSTMLNTAFGMNFAVSAGRCTRGIYAQLIPLEESKRKLLGCDYILLLDTEGLRAPELSTAASSYEKDNELATFVVGTSDLTIINIMGETGSEMNDVLQIVIQALLRMKKVRVSPRCVMVHQNVNDIQAFESTKAARQNLKEILDEATRCAAEMEKSPEQQFTDVIEFNYDDPTCVWYVPSLFSGTHVNPKYVQKVRDLKECIFQKLSEDKEKFLMIDNIPEKISLLWKAVIREDFVFSFKNSREVMAYRSLQDEIAKWNWALSESGSEWKRQALNKITGCWESDKTLISKDTLNEDLHKSMDIKCSEATDAVENFFATSRYKLIMEQWRNASVRKLENLKEVIMEEVWNHCLEQIQSKKLEETVSRNNERYETMMIEVARNTLSKITIESSTDEEVQECQLTVQFEKFWDECLRNLYIEEGFKDLKPININAAMSRSLSNIFNDPDLMKEVCRLQLNENSQLWDFVQIPQGEWMNLVRPNGTMQKIKKTIKNAFMNWLSDENLKDFQKFTENVMKSVEEFATSYFRKAEGVNISSTDTDEIFKLLKGHFDTFASSFPSFKLELRFKAMATMYVMEKATEAFNKAQGKFARLNDPRVMFEMKCRKTYFDFFEGKFKGISNACMISSSLSSSIKSAIQEEMEKKIPHLLATRLMFNTSFPKSKQSLIAYMLLKLGADINEDSNLKPMMALIEYPFHAMEKMLRELVCCLYDKEKEDFEQFFSREAEELLKFTREKITEADDDDLTSWIRQFQELINASGQFTLNLPAETIAGITSEGPIDVAEIKNQLIQASQKWWESAALGEEELENAAKVMTDTKILVGCRERCPFCKVFCDLTDANHVGVVNHSCQVHWPSGMAGWRGYYSGILVPKICTTQVASDSSFTNRDTNREFHPYKDYKEIYPDWDIVPDASIDASGYWKWFMANFSKELVIEYPGTKPPAIPMSWKLVSWGEAKKSLSSTYNVTLDDSLIDALSKVTK